MRFFNAFLKSIIDLHIYIYFFFNIIFFSQYIMLESLIIKEEKIIKDIRNLFRQEEETKSIKDKILRDITNLLNMKTKKDIIINQ